MRFFGFSLVFKFSYKFVIHIVFIGLFVSQNANGQSILYKQKIAELFGLPDSISELSYETPSGEFDPTQTKYNDIENMIFSIFKSHDKRSNLKHSSLLTSLSFEASKYLPESKFKERKKKWKLQRSTDRIMRHLSCPFGIVEFYSFTIDLVNDNGGRYFFDRKGDSDLKLFKGSKKHYKEIEDYEPLKMLSYNDISTKIQKDLKRKNILKNIENKTYSYVGIHVRKLEKTFNRNKIPQARIVIYLGARRLQFVPEK